MKFLKGLFLYDKEKHTFKTLNLTMLFGQIFQNQEWSVFHSFLSDDGFLKYEWG